MSVTSREIPVADFDFTDESLGAKVDLHAQLAEWRRESPAWQVQLFGSPAVLMLSYELVAAAFKDDENLPAADGYRSSSGMALGPFISTYEGREHRVRRAILSPPFRRRIIPTYLELIRDAAHELVDEMAPLGRAELVSGFTKRFPLRVISRMLGLPPGHDDADMATMALDLIRWNFDAEAAMRAKARYVEMVTPLIEERRARPGTDLISAVITTEFEGEHLDDEDTQAFVRHLFPAGADTTLLGLGVTLHALFTQPALMELALTRPETRSAIIEEAMRWDAPVANLPRNTPSDRAIVWNGIPMEPSTWMIYSIMSANRDPSVFANPDRLDPGRRNDTAPLTFGLGTHFCVGNHLAMAEIAVGLDALLDRLPRLALDDDPAAVVTGTILRGPATLPVTFDPVA